MPTYNLYSEKLNINFTVTADSREEALAKAKKWKERRDLEAEAAQAKAGQEKAQANLEKAEAADADTLGENLYEAGMYAVNKADELALGGVDLLTAYPRTAYNTLMRGLGMEDKAIGSVMDLMGDFDPRKQAERVAPEEGYARMAAEAVGTAPVVAASFAPRAIQGAGNAGSLIADLLGAGSAESQLGNIGAKAQKSMYDTAINQMETLVERAPNKTPNAARQDITGTYDFSTDEGVAQAANDINDELTYANNKINLPEYEEAAAKGKELQEEINKIDKQLEKLKDPAKIEAKEAEKLELFEQLEELGKQAPKFEQKAAGQNVKVIEELSARYNLNPVEAAKQIARQGGLKPAEGFQEIVERNAAMNRKMYDGDGTDSAGLKAWVGRLVRPVSEVVSDKVGGLVGRKFENAFETAARNTELFSTKYLSRGDELEKVRKWADNPEIKAAFLDLRSTGKAGRNRLLAQAGQQLGRKEFGLLKELFEDAEKHQKESRRLFRKDVVVDEVFWPSAKKAEAPEPTYASERRVSKQVTGANERARKLGSEMEMEELDTYQNPLVALMDRVVEEQTMLQLAKQFDLPPSLAKGSNSADFFAALESKFLKESGDVTKAKVGRQLIEETYNGLRKSPPKAVQIFNKQMYAGTLGQLDSAVLNLHDVAVSMMRNGVKPTFKALVDRGEVDPRKLGITNDARSMGEFKEGFDSFFERSGVEKAADWYVDKSFKISGFQQLDRLGKGTVLRAALNKARESAKAGTLVKDFGYMMDPRELAVINKALKKGTKLDDMTPREQELVTQLMFSRLGEQQLISAAGRPLAYLQHPSMRWAYAMTGFAIKQAEMMKKGIVDNIAKGNFKEAGDFFARYMMFTGVGYGIINQLRQTPQYLLGNDNKEPSLEGFAQDVIDQPLAAITFNRLGDQYSRGQFARDPVEAALNSVVPPTGLVGNVAKDIAAIFSDNDIPLKTLNSIPYGDELRALLKD